MTYRLSALAIASFLVACGSDDPDVVDPDVEMDIVDIALSDASFSTLASAIVDAGLEDALRGDGPFTVFAPTNQAFDDLGVDLGTLSTGELSAILQYHVVSGDVGSSQVPALADSLNGYTLFFDTSSGVVINGGTNVTTADIDATNGVIHVIDTILLPPTILDAAGYAGLTELAGAVGAADPAVADLLASEGSYTVFAPTNEAFTSIADVTAGLSQAQLTEVLSYHVIGAAVESDAVPARADTLLANPWGNGVTMLFDTSNGVMINGASEVVIADVHTTNGVIHVVDNVLLPPTVVDHASAAGLTGLLGAVVAASGDLGSVLSSNGPFTVFAPTNQAFTDIEDVTATLSADQIADVLLYHVVGGPSPVLSTDLASGEVQTLLPDQTVTVDLSSGVQVEGANVVSADINGTNGVVHVIDKVMVPAL